MAIDGSRHEFARYLNTLPVIPDIAAKILFMVGGDEDLSFAELEKTIQGDPSLSAKVLKIANSALYSRPQSVVRLSTAVALLGFNTIRSLALLVIGSNLFSSSGHRAFFRAFWKHSLVTAFHAKELAQTTGHGGLAEDVFTAGLLHNLGQPALLLADPLRYPSLRDEAVRDGYRLREREADFYGVTHGEVGSAVLEYWSFPPFYIDIAREHGNDHFLTPHRTAATLVTVAGFLASNTERPPRLALPLARLSPCLPVLGLETAGLEAWEKDFLPRMTAQPLFRACAGLFQD